LKNFYRSQFSKWPPQYRKNSTWSNQFGTSLSTHISNCDDIGQCWFFAILWGPFWKWRPGEIVQCQESIQDIKANGSFEMSHFLLNSFTDLHSLHHYISNALITTHRFSSLYPSKKYKEKHDMYVLSHIGT
jgi:hypothetical protein